jgi:hypothetical protein
MSDPVARCTLAFADALAWCRAWETELRLGTCFVAVPDPLPEQTQLLVQVSVSGVGEVLVAARVAFPDVDDSGKPGLRLNVATADVPALRRLYQKA